MKWTRLEGRGRVEKKKVNVYLSLGNFTLFRAVAINILMQVELWREGGLKDISEKLVAFDNTNQRMGGGCGGAKNESDLVVGKRRCVCAEVCGWWRKPN